MRSKPTVLAVDWDGVLHDRSKPVEGRHLGIPYPDAKKAMEKLYRKNFRLIIHTCVAHTPAGYQAVVDWLDYYDMPYHDVTAVKPVADLYIDDKAIHHTDWDSTLKQIKQRS